MACSAQELENDLEYKFSTNHYKQTQLHFGISNFQKIHESKQLPSIIGTHIRKYRGSKRIQNSVSKCQTHLDLGQKELIFSICPKCGMVYNSTNSDDWKLHNTLHPHVCYPSCLHIGRFIEDDLVSPFINSKIIRITKNSNTRQLRRARLLWDYLQSDHGFVVQFLDFARSDMQLYICIHEENSKVF